MIWKELQTVAPSTRHYDVPTGYRYLAPCLYTVQTQNLQAQACTVALELPTPIAAERHPALGHLIYLHEYLCCLEARHRLAAGIKQRQPREAVHAQRHRQQCQRHRDTGVGGQLLDGGVLQPLHQERRRGSACRMRVQISSGIYGSPLPAGRRQPGMLYHRHRDSGHCAACTLRSRFGPH